MSGKFREFEGKYVRIFLVDGRVVEGYAALCLAAEDDSDGVEYDSIQLDPRKGVAIFFDDEIKSVEIIEP